MMTEFARDVLNGLKKIRPHEQSQVTYELIATWKYKSAYPSNYSFINFTDDAVYCRHQICMSIH